MATKQELLIEANKRGLLSGNKKALFDEAVRRGVIQLPDQGVGLMNEDVPTFGPTSEQRPTPKQPDPTIGEQITGAGETALTLATGATGGTVGMIAGTLKGLAQEIASGNFGSKEAADRIEQEAAKLSQQLTFEPRTEAGKQTLAATGEALAPLAALPAVAPELAVAGQAGRFAAQGVAPVATRAAGSVAPAVAKVTRAAGDLVPDAIRPEPKDVGAAETELATVRRETAQGLPVPIKLTRGAETREAEQLAFEKEQIKGPLGQPLRDRAEENNLQILQNFDELFERTGAEVVDPVTTGNRVVNALAEGYKAAKKETREAYKAARGSKEAENEVNLTAPVTIGRGDQEITGSVIDYINSKPVGVPSSAVTDSARQIITRLGLATEGDDGQLVPTRATVGQMEDLRRELSGIASKVEPVQVRDETIIKKLIDAHTDEVSGPLFKKARALRTKQARKFENRAVVARLLNNRRGMDDPQVAADQVFNKSILNASPDEIRFLKRVILTSGENGKQAWKELQGAMFNHIRDEATKGMGMDSQNNPLVSPAKLHQTVNALDKNGRLDLVLDKKNAETVRDLNDVARFISTVPPGTLINNSGTSGALLAAIGEAGATGFITGLPVPVLTTLRALSDRMKDAKMRAKIKRALNEKPANKGNK